MKTKTAKSWKGKCDKLVRQLLLQTRDNCHRCGKTTYLQVSHIISRRYSATRCELDNVQLLCAGCHMYFTHWPREFSKWIEESIGLEKYEALKQKANQVTKMNWRVEYERLDALQRQNETA